MSTIATTKISHTFRGDLNLDMEFNGRIDPLSAAEVQILDLAIGNNTITPPPTINGNVNVFRVTIVPPVTNLTPITLKGINGDTGVVLDAGSPSTIALGSPTATFVLFANGAIIPGVRLIWS